MNTIFYAKNLAGDIKEISYRNIEEIHKLLEEAFGKIPLYKPLWINEQGIEFSFPKNEEIIYILYKYINVNVIFEFNCILQELDFNYSIQYEKYTLIITKEEMEGLYEEISISFYTNPSNIFYSEERSNIDILDEEYDVKYITGPPIGETFKSIQDLFLSFRSYYNISEDFFIHLAQCVQEKWNIYKEGIKKEYK
jgi:hypothetical protein